MSQNNLSRNEQILEEYRPKKQEGKESNFIPKDELFDQFKTFINKNDQREESIKVDWKSISLNGYAIVLHKGKPILERELVHFDNAARAHFLNEVIMHDDIPVIEEMPPKLVHVNDITNGIGVQGNSEVSTSGNLKGAKKSKRRR